EHESVIETEPPYRDWFQGYSSEKWPETNPPLPMTGDGALDVLIGRAWQVWTTVVRESRLAAHDRRALREISIDWKVPEEANDGRWSVRLLRQIDSDHWMESFLKGLVRKVELDR